MDFTFLTHMESHTARQTQQKETNLCMLILKLIWPVTRSVSTGFAMAK